MALPPLAVSLGDPAGIGAEIAVRVWLERRTEVPAFICVGDPGALLRAAQRAGLTTPDLHVVEHAAEIAGEGDGRLTVLHTPLAVEESPGSPAPANASATIAAIERAVACVRSGHAAALVTLPIAKAVLHDVGFGFPGHTEFIAHLVADAHWPAARGPVMMLAGPDLRVALVTIHTPLAQVAAALSRDRIVQVGQVVHEALVRDFGVARPRLALCGLNPHAGERGGIGREEIDLINPAASLLRTSGVDVGQARPSDSLFHAEARGSYDAVIAMYHDQGLIPIKTLHFWRAVNVTLGLPIVRTSPDHGVGFDIAGKNLARVDSFVEALKLAHEMAERRARHER